MPIKLRQHDIKEIFFRLTKIFDQEKDFLNELDSQIGDGDHGLTMSRGFNAVCKYITKYPYLSVSDLLVNGGLQFNEKAGATMGILMYSAMRAAGLIIKNQAFIDLPISKNMLVAAIEAIQKRGKSSKGQKTILDTLIPVLEYLDELGDNYDGPTIIKKSIEIALQAAESTKKMESQIGRARWFKDRSIGAIDPGAYSGYLIIKTIGEYQLEKVCLWVI